MIAVIERIRKRLAEGAYLNEAAVSHGIVSPLLSGLGWDTSDPSQVVPEHTSGRGRVDFALLGAARRPAVFIEVKGVGRSIEGDRQLFEYAFHEGVPLCVLTDGREWSFYLPSGQGTYNDRRLYRLQLDDREPAECERVLLRYLSHERVRSGAAFDDAQRDYRDLAGRREARDALPKAWRELVSEREELMLELISDKAEALSGFRPSLDDVASFLAAIGVPGSGTVSAIRPKSEIVTPVSFDALKRSEGNGRSSLRIASEAQSSSTLAGRAVKYRIFGEEKSASNANAAFVDVIKALVARNVERVPLLAAAVQGRSRNHIARSPAEIYPSRPDLARAAEIGHGWLVGLNIANREKVAITRTACDIFELRFGSDVVLELPNAD